MHEKAQELSFEMNRFCMKDQLQRLTKENRDLKIAYEQVKEENAVSNRQQGDMQLFLNEKLDDQYNLIDELENKLIQIKTSHKFEKQDLIEEFKEENDKLKSSIANVRSELKIATDKLDSLEQYKKERTKFMQHKAELESELAMVKNETTRQLIQLDRQRVKSKEKMATDLREAIKATKKLAEIEFQSSYASTTLKAMEQNKRMFADLKYQEKEARKLMAENKELLTKNSDLSTELKMYKSVQSEFATKSQVYQKVIRKLQQKNEIQQVERGGSSLGPRINGGYPQKGAKSRFTNHLQSLQRKVKKQQAVIAQLKDELQAHEDRNGDLLSFLLLSIEDVKRHPSIADKHTRPHSSRFHVSNLPQDYVSLDLSDREQLLDYFVACVHSKSLTVAKSNFTTNVSKHPSLSPSLSLPPITDEPPTASVRSIGVQTDDKTGVGRSETKRRMPSMYAMTLDEDASTFVTSKAPGLDFEVRGFGKLLSRTSHGILDKARGMRTRTAPTTAQPTANYFL